MCFPRVAQALRERFDETDARRTVPLLCERVRIADDPISS
jgi:hypothetical protein